MAEAPLEETLIILDGKYRLDARLGEGAAGVVYRALHLGLKKPCALKLLKGGVRDAFALARFRREAEALGQLRHPNVVEVTDFGIDPSAGTAGGVPYLVMELLDGATLAEVCREQGPLPLEEALPLLAAIAAAVDAAHARGILHRDLKPGNVLLGRDPDGGPLVKVVDFGLAEIAEDPRPHPEAAPASSPEETAPSLTLTGALLGTPLYVAPEVIRHRAASRASDVYAFGVIAYELLAGRPPFGGSTAAVLAGHLHAEPPPPAPRGAPLPEPVWQALREPLSKDPVARPASAGEVVRRLHLALNQAAEAAALERWRTAEVPRRACLSALLLVAVLLAGLLLPWPLIPAVERRMHDIRLRTAPTVPPDPRILLLTVDDASLDGGGSSPGPSLAERADEFARVLDRVFAAGARGVAIDLLVHARWSQSSDFSGLVLRHPEALTLAAFSAPDGSIVGTECVAGLTAAALGPERMPALFGLVNLEEDLDGVTREGRPGYRDRSGATRLSWSGRAAQALVGGVSGDTDRFWIDSRIDWPRYDRISWRDVPAALDRDPGRFSGRLVLVGGEFLGSGDDYHRVPHRSRATGVVSGLTLQALLVDTLARGRPVREPGRAAVLAVTVLLTGLAVAGILCARRARAAAAWLAGAAVAAGLYAALSFPAFGWVGLVMPVSSPLGLGLLGCLLACVCRWAQGRQGLQGQQGLEGEP